MILVVYYRVDITLVFFSAVQFFRPSGFLFIRPSGFGRMYKFALVQYSGSETLTSLNLLWSKRGWFKNGRDFVSDHLKSESPTIWKPTRTAPSFFNYLKSGLFFLWFSFVTSFHLEQIDVWTIGKQFNATTLNLILSLKHWLHRSPLYSRCGNKSYS